MRKWVYIVLIVIFAVIFLVSGGMLLDYYIKSNQAAESYNELAQLVQQAQQTAPTEESLPEGETAMTEPVIPMVEIMDPETGELVQVLAEYAAIYALNRDTVGWIRIDGTRINYPVMHRPEQVDYYLHRNFYEEYSVDGAIYVREPCDVFMPTDNVVIYGHRMNSGAMFADLLQYKEEDFFAQNRYIQFDTIREHHTYEILSVFTISASVDNGFQYHLFVDAATQEQFDAFVTQCKRRALYDTGVDAVYGDRLITLSTCEKGDSNRRVVVVAKRIA